MTDTRSFERFLKKALRSYIYKAEELKASEKSKHIPFLIIGFKGDVLDRERV